MLLLPKKVFRQGEKIPVTIQLSELNQPITKVTLSLIGNEKTEFTMHSIIGKKGFQPILGLIFPSRRMKTFKTFLNQSYTLDLDQVRVGSESFDLEIPENAIPSYYGDNAKITYNIQLDIMFQDGKQSTKIEEVLIDSDYSPSIEVKEMEIVDGQLIVQYPNPLYIGRENRIEISTVNLTSVSPIRFYLKGTEVLTASGVTMENHPEDLPLGQIQFDTDLNNLPVIFSIPSTYQHSYKGLNSRLEYIIEICNIQSKKRLNIKREVSSFLSQFPVVLEYPKNGQNNLRGS